MIEKKFSPDYYLAEKTSRDCIEKLNSILDESGREILAAYIKAQNTIFSEQVSNRFYEGWRHGASFSK